MESEQEIRKQKESEERTSVLANERTYAAWLRTGLTSLAGGLGIEKLIGGANPIWQVRTISSILIILSGACFLLAAWRYMHVGVRMVSTHVSGAPIALLCIMSVLFIIASIMAFVGLWVTNGTGY